MDPEEEADAVTYRPSDGELVANPFGISDDVLLGRKPRSRRRGRAASSSPPAERERPAAPARTLGRSRLGAAEEEPALASPPTPGADDAEDDAFERLAMEALASCDDEADGGPAGNGGGEASLPSAPSTSAAAPSWESSASSGSQAGSGARARLGRLGKMASAEPLPKGRRAQSFRRPRADRALREQQARDPPSGPAPRSFPQLQVLRNSAKSAGAGAGKRARSRKENGGARPGKRRSRPAPPPGGAPLPSFDLEAQFWKRQATKHAQSARGGGAGAASASSAAAAAAARPAELSTLSFAPSWLKRPAAEGPSAAESEARAEEIRDEEPQFRAQSPAAIARGGGSATPGAASSSSAAGSAGGGHTTADSASGSAGRGRDSRRRRARCSGELGRALEALRHRRDGGEARLRAGEFPFAEARLPAWQRRGAGASAPEDGVCDVTDPRAAAKALADVEVIGKAADGAGAAAAERALRSAIVGYRVRVVRVAARSEADGGGLRAVEGREVLALFKEEAARRMGMEDGAVVRVYDPVMLPGARDLGAGAGEFAAAMGCTQVAERVP